MVSYSHKHCSGISLLETLLVLMLVATGILLGMKQYFQYERNKDLTQIQQSVDQLLQAGKAYYYANCSSIKMGQVSLQTLQAMGAIPNLDVANNPWGQPFEVWIIGNSDSGEASTPPYLIQVRGDFSDRTTDEIGQVAALLGADNWAGGKILNWTKLPNQVLKHLPISVQSPGGWVPTISGTYNGGQAISSNLEVMNGDLAKFSKDEADKTKGFTCPN